MISVAQVMPGDIALDRWRREWRTECGEDRIETIREGGSEKVVVVGQLMRKRGDDRDGGGPSMQVCKYAKTEEI